LIFPKNPFQKQPKINSHYTPITFYQSYKFQKTPLKNELLLLTQLLPFSTIKVILRAGNEASASIDVEVFCLKFAKGGVTMSSVTLDDLDVLYAYWFFYATFSPDYFTD